MLIRMPLERAQPQARLQMPPLIQSGANMAEVARVKTPTTPDEVGSELARQLLSITVSPGHPMPSREQAGLLLAQLMLETANGAACYNWNVGNITSRESGTFYRPVWFTIDETSSPKMKQLHEAMLHGQAPRAFRAYSSLSGGVRDYLAELKRDFPSLLTASESGDADEFGAAIRTSKYTPDAPQGTIESIRHLQAQYLSKGMFAELPPLVAPTTDSDLPEVPAS